VIRKPPSRLSLEDVNPFKKGEEDEYIEFDLSGR
jgi:hypothetical protein